jgi:hypothetical protein
VRPQQPPGNQIPVPRVDDDVHILIEQITLNDRYVHLARPPTIRRCGPASGNQPFDLLQQVLHLDSMDFDLE